MKTQDKATARPWVTCMHYIYHSNMEIAKCKSLVDAKLIVKAVNAWDSISLIKERIKELETIKKG